MRILSDTAFFCQLALKGPFLVTDDILAEVRRLPGDRNAVTHLRRTAGHYAREMHVHYLERLAARDLTPAQRRLAHRHLSGARFLLAQSLFSSDRAAARQMLRRSASIHPSPLKGWLKAAIAGALGPAGFRLFEGRNDMLDRS